MKDNEIDDTIKLLKDTVHQLDKSDKDIENKAIILQEEYIKNTNLKAKKREIVVSLYKAGVQRSYIASLIKINKGSLSNMFRKGKGI